MTCGASDETHGTLPWKLTIHYRAYGARGGGEDGETAPSFSPRAGNLAFVRSFVSFVLTRGNDIYPPIPCMRY